ncbi:MAG: glucosamine inositolphosphorylceramide transferase family protein [Beijerinckiaceae bacterium]
MDITLVLDPSHIRHWHYRLAIGLQQRGHDVAVMWKGSTAHTPAPINTLMMLEDCIFRHRPNPLARTIIKDVFKIFPVRHSHHSSGLILDLSGTEWQSDSNRTNKHIWKLTYNNSVCEGELWRALLDQETPYLAICDQNEVPVMTAFPAIEETRRLGSAADNVFAAILTMCLSSVNQFGRAGGEISPPLINPRRAVKDSNVITFFTTALSTRVIQKLEKLLHEAPRWKTAWRQLGGADKSRAVIDSLQWPARGYTILPDDGQRYYADPFPVHYDGKTYVFVEEFPLQTQKGILSVCEMKSEGAFGTPRPCLEADVHLSYPQIFIHNEMHYMIPESCANGRVDLYRATAFPFEWRHEKTLLTGISASDMTMIQHDGLWWMLGTCTNNGGSTWDTLHAYFASDLLGDWQPHPGNPLLIDARSARPAGAIVRRENTLLRPVQNCAGGYGSGLGIAKITKLNCEEFSQTVIAQLKPDPRWNASGVHTLNSTSRMEAIDYFA